MLILNMKVANIHFIVFIGFIVMIYYATHTPNKIEGFSVQFGTPPETTDVDHGHIKTLLEIGSQSHENTKYDVVSTHLLGDISEPAPPGPPPPPPDPVCFLGDSLSNDRTEIDRGETCCVNVLNK
jgi:hypothetical protein